MTGKKQILVSYVFSTDGSKSEDFLLEETLLQFCFMYEDKSKSIIVDTSSTEEIKSEYIHKNINKEKDANNESEYEEPTVTYNPVVKEPRYFNVF